MTYVTHARTPEELRAEVESDIRRRGEALALQLKYATSATEKAKISFAINVMADMANYWSDLKIIRPFRKRKDRTTIPSEFARTEDSENE